jgi:hypothetical protein
MLFTLAGIATGVGDLYRYHEPPVELRLQVQEPERELAEVRATSQRIGEDKPRRSAGFICASLLVIVLISRAAGFTPAVFGGANPRRSPCCNAGVLPRRQ